MNEYTSKKEREHIEAQFDAFMNHSIRNCAHNVTRMVSVDEKSEGVYRWIHWMKIAWVSAWLLTSTTLILE